MTTLEHAARQALEALDGLIPYLFLTDETLWGKYYKALSALRKALEQPKQEPVAWMYDWEAEGETVTDWLTSDYDEAHSPTMGYTNIRPLYTAPPKREWVGLEDVEIEDALNDLPLFRASYVEIARAIEAKLKELNT